MVPDSKDPGLEEAHAYALVTSVRNEAERIGATIQTVVDQTVLPVAWAIVSDASTDSTDAVVAEYAQRYPFIRPLRIDREGGASFAAKSRAVARGYDSIRDCKFDFVGNLDADMKLPPGYYETVTQAMAQGFTNANSKNPKIGIAGGSYLNIIEGRAIPAKSRPGHVPGAVQVFRRECWEQIGGYPELSFGGEDTAAEMAAELAEWGVLALPELEALHGAPDQAKGIATAAGRMFRSGAMDYHLGYGVGFMGIKAASRFLEPPAILGSLARLAGFAMPLFRQDAKELAPELRSYIREAQKRRIRSLLGRANAPEAGPQHEPTGQ